VVDGVLVVDKPSGPTSFQVVDRVRKATGARKAGHTGTLDPLASGVLAICLGEATKVAQYLTAQDKAYDAVLTLGTATDSLDAQGQVTERADVPTLTAAQVEAALGPFRAQTEQVPPMVSAVKVQGQRLYELARAGEVVERAARPVTVHALTLLDQTASTLTLHVECSKGYFVRVLADGLARALGTVGHLSSLRRTRVGAMGLDRAVTLEQVEALGPKATEGRLLSLDEALASLPELSLTAAQAVKVGHGVPLEMPGLSAPGPYRLKGPSGALLALAALERSKLKYLRVLRP